MYFNSDINTTSRKVKFSIIKNLFLTFPLPFLCVFRNFGVENALSHKLGGGNWVPLRHNYVQPYSLDCHGGAMGMYHTALENIL